MNKRDIIYSGDIKIIGMSNGEVVEIEVNGVVFQKKVTTYDELIKTNSDNRESVPPHPKYSPTRDFGRWVHRG